MKQLDDAILVGTLALLLDAVVVKIAFEKASAIEYQDAQDRGVRA